MTGQLTINGQDAYTTWGMTLESSSLSALMTPAPMKENLHSESRLAHGKTVTASLPRMAARSVTLILQLTARTEEEFFTRYASFCDELATGFLDIATAYQPGTVYHFEYLSCTQFTQFMRGIAKFTLKLTENDPSSRD